MTLTHTALSRVSTCRGSLAEPCPVTAEALLGAELGSGHGGQGSWAAQGQLLHCTWELPGPGVETMSPALAGGFLTPGPPGCPGGLFKDCRARVVEVQRQDRGC